MIKKLQAMLISKSNPNKLYAMIEKLQEIQVTAFRFVRRLENGKCAEKQIR